MYFRVKKELRWDNKLFQRGDHIDIPEGNPRIGGLLIGGFIVNDSTSPHPDEPERQGIPISEASKRITKSRA